MGGGHSASLPCDICLAPLTSGSGLVFLEGGCFSQAGSLPGPTQSLPFWKREDISHLR